MSLFDLFSTTKEKYFFKDVVNLACKDTEFSVIQSKNLNARIVDKDNFVFYLKPSEFGFKDLSDKVFLSKSEVDNLIKKIRDFLEKQQSKRKSNLIKAPRIRQTPNNSSNLEFRVPLIIDNTFSLNTIKIYGSHWNRSDEKKLISDAVKIYLKKSGFNQTFSSPVSIEMAFKSNLDISNHGYLFKIIEDCLVAEQVISDDNDKIVQEVIMKKQNEFDGVIIKVQKISNLQEPNLIHTAIIPAPTQALAPIYEDNLIELKPIKTKDKKTKKKKKDKKKDKK